MAFLNIGNFLFGETWIEGRGKRYLPWKDTELAICMTVDAGASPSTVTTWSLTVRVYMLMAP
jgi:hypothetical protein